MQVLTRPKLTDDNDHRAPPHNVYWIDTSHEGELTPHADVVLSLSGVSRMLGIGMLRLLCFEALGLTKRRYRNGRQRVYGWADCERITLLIKAKRAGVTLRQIIPVLRAVSGDSDPEVRRRALARSVMLIDRLAKQRLQLDIALSELNHVCALLAKESSDNGHSGGQNW
jgi:DNA-binding transcriptional MerR regulator